jgi:hypothetical protein
MWPSTNRFLKRNYPRSHQLLKRVAGPWLRGELGLPIPSCLGWRIAWTQPRLAVAEAPEPHIRRWIQQTLYAGNTFFDVGGHCGWMSITAAHSVGPTGCVVAFEPSPPLNEILSYHKKVNRLAQMEIVPFAVSYADRMSTPFFLVNGGLSYRNSLTIGPSDPPNPVLWKRHPVRFAPLAWIAMSSIRNAYPTLSRSTWRELNCWFFMVLKDCWPDFVHG